MVDSKDARAVARKILRCPARVFVSEAVSVKGKTQDMSMAGISLMLEAPVPLGRSFGVVFDAPLHGKPVKVQVKAKAVYCSVVGTAGFRVGMQFEPLPEATAKLIRQLLQ